jgi:general secretion pathway protein D
MMKQNHLRGVSATAALILLCAPALEAGNRKGDKLLKQGQAAEAKGDWDAALDFYEKAVDEGPTDPAYLIAMRRARFEDGQMHVNRGQKIRSEGKVQEAYQEFQKALVADPSSDIAIQELKRTQQMLEGAKAGAAQTGLTPVEQVRQEQLERIDSMLGPPVLKPVIQRVPTLKMNNQPPRILYETVGKLAGVNVVFDSQYSPPAHGFNVDLSNSTVQQAFDYLAILTHTFWKPISSNTIFVTEDNVTKRRDYADEVVKVFYITNATTPQEFQEIATAVRTVCNIRQVFTYNAQKAMVVRGTVDEVALAEKVIHDLDKPKAEVVVDVVEMEVNSARTRDLAATLVSAGTAGLNVPITFAPRSSIAIGGGGGSTTNSNGSTTAAAPVIPLSNLGRISTADFATTLPGALLQAMLMDNRTKVLSSPQVRASDGMKVTLQIGDRYPYATGSFQPGIGAVGGGVSPLVSTQFNFVDTGITVEITPQVHSSTDVSLHVEVTISAVKQVVNLGGISQPVIGQRKSSADIRLRDGEVNILGGLNQIQNSSAVNGIPGLVDIPVLGKLLFGSDHTENDREELLIALIPHIVSTPNYTPENLRGIYAGQDQVVKVNYAPTPEAAAPKPAPVTPAPAKPEAAAPVTPAPPAAPAAQTRLSFQPGVVQVSPNAPFTLTVRMDNAVDASSVTPLRIKFDPALVRLNDATAGDLLGRVATVKDIRNDTGEATLTLTRPPGAAGVSGSGALATLSFTAVGRGAGTVSITQANVKNSRLETLPVTLASVPVRVQ